MVYIDKKIVVIVTPYLIELILNSFSYSQEATFYHIIRYIIQGIMIILSVVSFVIEAMTKPDNGEAKASSIILILLAIAIIIDLIFEVLSLLLFIHYSNSIFPLSKLGYGIHFISLSYLFVVISEINEKNN